MLVVNGIDVSFKSLNFFARFFTGNHDAKFYEEMQTRISDLSLLLFDKLEFLEVSKKGLTNFQVMFIELEVRWYLFIESSSSVYS